MSIRVLIVEDNADNRKLIAWVLGDIGYEWSEAETAEQGLAPLGKEHFDIVLMDISLPGIDGLEATRRIRKNPEWSDLPIIAVTAHAIKGEDAKIFDAGVSALVTKPVNEVLLVQRMKELLKAKLESG